MEKTEKMTWNDKIRSIHSRYELVVKQNGLALRYVPNLELVTYPQPRLFYNAIQNNPLALRYVPMYLRTRELCDFAVHQSDLALAFVPKDHQTIIFDKLKHQGSSRLARLSLLFIVLLGGLLFSAPLLIGGWWAGSIAAIYALLCFWVFCNEKHRTARRLEQQMNIPSAIKSLLEEAPHGRFVEVGGLCWYNKPLRGGSGQWALTKNNFPEYNKQPFKGNTDLPTDIVQAIDGYLLAADFYTETTLHDKDFLLQMGLRLVEADEWQEFREKTYMEPYEQGGLKGVLFIDKQSGTNLFVPFLGYWNHETPGELDHTQRGYYRLASNLMVVIDHRSSNIGPAHPDNGLPVMCVAISRSVL